MSSLSRGRLAAAAVALLAAVATSGAARAGPPMSTLLEPPPPAHVTVPDGLLRVCSDPNNLPFSNRREEGFENAIAQILGRELHREVTYTWWPQRRGFIRMTLRAGLCDVVMGVPAAYELTANTAPYYRSTYVFVSRAGALPGLATLDDPRLRELRIGVPLIGDDYANPPPVEVLAARGMARNVRGFSIYGDYSRPDPPRAVVDAVARGDVDVAVAWGPLAGYFASRAGVPLAIAPIAPVASLPQLPMAYDIAMGVRHGDTALLRALDAALHARAAEIHAVLTRYGVPLLPEARIATGQ